MTRDDSLKRVVRTGLVVVMILVIAGLLLTRCDVPQRLLVAPPKPIILSAPPRATNRSQATFTYTNKWKGVSYKCVLDRVLMHHCPKEGRSYGRLRRGKHTFNIAAKKGTLLSERVKYTWVVVGPGGRSDDGTTTPTTATPSAATPTTSQPPSSAVGSFPISGDVEGLLAPGLEQPVNVVFSNPWSFPIKVVSLTIAVRDLTERNGVANPACVGSENLVVTQSLEAVPRIPANRTRSLQQLGVPLSQWPLVLMPDLPVNQDACKNTHFTLHYSGTATR